MMTTYLYILAGILVLVGLWALLTRRNIVKIILGFSILDTGIHMFLVAIGYRKDGTAPIFDGDLQVAQALEKAVDPIPSALVLTAIVIGLAVTALMLSYAVRLAKRNKSLMIDKAKELKW
ncbi:MAG: sodium:proton antiporter [Spirochaetaceae bacterium]